MIKNIIFDFGNVLGWTLADYTTKTYVTDPEEQKLIRKVVFDPQDWDLLNRGKMTDEEMLKKVCAQLPEHLWEDACIVYNNWTNTATPVPGMIRLVKELKEKGYKMYLLSNATDTFAEKYKDIPWMCSILDRFDGLVFSAKVGMAKPDREIYEYVLNTYHLKAEETMFVDDYKENIEACEKVGITGYHFDQDAQKLKGFIETH